MLKHSRMLVSVECAGLRHLAGHRTVQRIEAVAPDLGPDPERGDTKAACAKGPEKTAEGCGDEGACVC